MIKQIRQGFTLIEMMIVVAIIGILAAIAIPNYIKLQTRAKQGEAKINLATAYGDEKAYLATADTFSNLVSLVNYFPERNNRYSYDLGGGSSAVYQTRQTSSTGTDTNPPVMTGIEADTFKWGTVGITSIMTPAFSAVVSAGQNGNFTATAAANIDADPTIDSWSISSYNRVSASTSSATANCASGANPAGDLCHDQDDVVY